MTTWNLAGWTAGVATLLVFQSGTPTVSRDLISLQAECVAEIGPFITDARSMRGRSQAARDSLLDRLDALDRRYLDTATDCAARLWEQRAILESLSDRHVRLIDVATRFEASPVARRLPEVTARMYSNRACAYYALGATTQAAEDTFRSAALARRLAAPVAVTSLLEAAESASLQDDWGEAERYVTEAHDLLRDSLAVRPVLQYVLGRLSAAEAGLIGRRLRAERDSTVRRHLARRLMDTSRVATDILARFSYPDPMQGVYDRGDLALALADGAHAYAVLGQMSAARDGLARANRLLDETVLDHYPDAALEVRHTQWTVEALVGDTAAAVETARHMRNEAAALEDVEMEAQALEAIAAFHEAAGEWRAAEQTYEAAVRLRDVQWERNRLHDWSAATFSRAQAAYRGLTRLHARTGRIRDAFAVLDGSRARALRDLQAELQRRETLTPERRAETDALLDSAHVLRMERLRSSSSVTERSEAAAALSALQRRIATATGGDDERPPSLDVDALQDALRREGRVLVSYLVEERESLAFVVTPDTVAAIALSAGADDIEHWMAKAGGPWATQEDAAVRLAPLYALHEALIRPLAALLPDKHPLIVVPDGPLFDLPFGLLVETPAEAYADAAFLIRRRPVSVEMAASLVTSRTPTSRLSRPLVAFGRSQFEGVPRLWRGAGDAPLSDLPNVAREIARVGDHAGSARLALDEDATEAQLTTWIDDARVVHLASHATSDPTSPPLSRIFLWDDPEADDDGVLHLYELQARHLQAELIVLSGCSTAQGRHQPGEGTLSFQYGVRAAGARAALATLWPVDDRAMADVMDAFYAGLADGLPKDRALQRAQVAYLDRHEGLDASPFFWASLVLTGNTAPVDLGRDWRWWGAAVSAAAATLVWMFVRRRHARRSTAALRTTPDPDH